MLHRAVLSWAVGIIMNGNSLLPPQGFHLIGVQMETALELGNDPWSCWSHSTHQDMHIPEEASVCSPEAPSWVLLWSCPLLSAPLVCRSTPTFAPQPPAAVSCCQISRWFLFPQGPAHRAHRTLLFVPTLLYRHFGYPNRGQFPSTARRADAQCWALLVCMHWIDPLIAH